MVFRKRRKVKISPNSKFVRIKVIKKAQIKTRDYKIDKNNIDNTTNTISILDFIEVQ